jgi:hypothetical protein
LSFNFPLLGTRYSQFPSFCIIDQCSFLRCFPQTTGYESTCFALTDQFAFIQLTTIVELNELATT